MVDVSPRVVAMNRDKDVEDYEEGISFVPLAGCRNMERRHERCVIHPNECPDGYQFVNPFDLHIMTNHQSCNNVAVASIGYCNIGSHNVAVGSNEGYQQRHQCAVTKDGCDNPDSFVSPHQGRSSEFYNHISNNGCTVLQDLNYIGPDVKKAGALTRYVGCRGGNIIDHADGDAVVCVTSVSECRALAGYDDTVTVTFSDPVCDCSRTRTGACFKMGATVVSTTKEIKQGFEYFCAVDEEICDTELGLMYQNVQQLTAVGNVDCRLCDARTVREYRIAASKTTDLSTGTIVGIAIGSAFVSALLVIGLMRLYFCCCSGQRGTNATSIPKIPAANSNTDDSSEENNELALEEEDETARHTSNDHNINNNAEIEDDVKIHSATVV